MVTIEGFVFEKPENYRTDEVTVALSPPGADVPSLIVQSRPAAADATAESLATELLEQLQRSMTGLVRSADHEMAFEDGGKGRVISCSISTERGDVRQYVVLRVHEGRVCTASVTTPADTSQAAAMSVMKCLASIRPAS